MFLQKFSTAVKGSSNEETALAKIKCMGLNLAKSSRVSRTWSDSPLFFTMDVSFLLPVEVFLLTVRPFYLRWGNRKQKRPNPISGQIFHRK